MVDLRSARLGVRIQRQSVGGRRQHVAFPSLVSAQLCQRFHRRFREAGGELPSDRREVSEALDLYALADFLTRPPGHHYFIKTVSLIRERLSGTA